MYMMTEPFKMTVLNKLHRTAMFIKWLNEKNKIIFNYFSTEINERKMKEK